MSRHLSSREVVDAVDGVLDAARARHLDRCALCERRVREAGQTIEHVQRLDEVPEPSPLFWEHLQARVKDRTQAAPAAGAGWRVWGFRAMALGVPALVAVMGILTADRQTRLSIDAVPEPDAPRVALRRDVPAVEAVDVPVWAEAVTLATAVPADPLELAVPVRAGTAETWLEDFTVDERAELVRLLREAMGGGL